MTLFGLSRTRGGLVVESAPTFHSDCPEEGSCRGRCGQLVRGVKRAWLLVWSGVVRQITALISGSRLPGKLLSVPTKLMSFTTPGRSDLRRQEVRMLERDSTCCVGHDQSHVARERPGSRVRAVRDNSRGSLKNHWAASRTDPAGACDCHETVGAPSNIRLRNYTRSEEHLSDCPFLTLPT